LKEISLNSCQSDLTLVSLSVDVSSVSVGECISPVLSVIGSTPIVRLLFVLGLLTLLRWRLVVLLLFLFGCLSYLW
jgi:hypothetical protein